MIPSRMCKTRIVVAAVCVTTLTPVSPIMYNLHADDTYEFGTMTVTTVGRSEKLNLKSNSTVLTRSVLDESDYWSVADLAMRIPNLSIQTNSGNFTFIDIRGAPPADTNQSNVAVYVDDVNYLDVKNIGDFLYDVETIEVLRGPQSIGYGRQATFGVLAVRSRQPVDRLEGSIGMSWGDRGLGRYDAVANLPLMPKVLSLRVAGVVWRQNGATENETTGNTTDDIDQWSSRATLRWLPLAGTEITFSINGDEVRGRGPPFVPDPFSSDPRTIRVDYDKFVSELNTIHPSVRVRYEADLFDATFISAYGKVDRDFDTELDFTSADLLRRRNAENQEQFTHELRLNSNGDEKSPGWSLGVYVFQEDLDEVDFRELRPDLTTAPFSIFDVIEEHRDNDGVAVFGSISYPLAERLTLTTALRHESERKSFDFQTYDIQPGSRTDKTAGSLDNDFEAWLPAVSLAYEFNPSQSGYVSISRGFRSGGFNGRGGGPDEREYDAEKAWTYEAGVDSSWMEDRLHVSLTLFNTDIDDRQAFQGFGGDLFIRNVGKSRTRGIELDMSVTPLRNLEFLLRWGYSDTENIEFIDSVSGADFSGNRIEGVPNYNFTAAVQYRYQLSRNWSGIFRIENQGAGKTYFDEANTLIEDAFQIWNVRTGVKNRRWEIYFWVKNLLDEEYIIRVFDLPLNLNGEFGPPRTVGANVRISF